MNEAMKQRLVGGVVLVALAVIFVPMVLDFTDSRQLINAESVVPPKPDTDYESVTIPLAQWAEKDLDDVPPIAEVDVGDVQPLVDGLDSSSSTGGDAMSQQVASEETLQFEKTVMSNALSVEPKPIEISAADRQDNTPFVIKKASTQKPNNLDQLIAAARKAKTKTVAKLAPKTQSRPQKEICLCQL